MGVAYHTIQSALVLKVSWVKVQLNELMSRVRCMSYYDLHRQRDSHRIVVDVSCYGQGDNWRHLTAQLGS